MREPTMLKDPSFGTTMRATQSPLELLPSEAHNGAFASLLLGCFASQSSSGLVETASGMRFIPVFPFTEIMQ
jgi:hypothetical protein